MKFFVVWYIYKIRKELTTMKATMNSLYFYSYELLQSLLFSGFEQGLIRHAEKCREDCLIDTWKLS